MALKVIRPRQPAPFLNPDRALNDARLLAQLSHPNIVRIFGAHRVGGDVGISMELLQGRTLEELVAQQGPFNAHEAMLFGVDVARALAAVHRARLLHGDVKAQNVMRAAGGRTVLMDFGAGYDVKTDEAAGRRLAGTPLYLAPEVFDGEPRTARGDIYSVGVLLFYLVTGTYPVDGQTGADVRRQHQAQVPRRMLRDLRPELPDAFIQVVERATAARAARSIPDRRGTGGGPEPGPRPWLDPAGDTAPALPLQARHRRRRHRAGGRRRHLRPLGRPRSAPGGAGEPGGGAARQPRASVVDAGPGRRTAATGSKRRSTATRAAATCGWRPGRAWPAAIASRSR